MLGIFLVLVSLCVSRAYESVESSQYVHRIAFGSCNHAERKGLWGNIEATKPHIMVLLGDNVYADRKKGLYKDIDFVIGSKFLPAREEDFLLQYGQFKNDLKWQSLLKYLGGMNEGDGNIRAIYDDHDYGINNGDRTFPLKVASQNHFLDWMQVPKKSPRRNRSGVYNSKVFDVQVPIQEGGQGQCNSDGDNGSSCNKSSNVNETKTRNLRYIWCL